MLSSRDISLSHYLEFDNKCMSEAILPFKNTDNIKIYPNFVILSKQRYGKVLHIYMYICKIYVIYGYEKT